MTYFNKCDIFLYMGIDGADRKPNIISSAFAKGKELIEKAGVTQLTKAELDWIRPAEIIDRSTPTHNTEVESKKIVEQCKKKDAQMSSINYPKEIAYSYTVVRSVAVFSDKEGSDDFDASILPDSDKVRKFIEFLSNSEKPVTLSEQFGELLRLADGSIIDATQIGMYASRMVARNLDHRAYPEIIIDGETRDKCHNNLLPFSSTNKPQDILGDNYYFWTTLYSSLELKDIVGGVTTKVLDKYAAKVMSWSRRVLAGQAVISDHSAAVNSALKISNSLSVLSKK